MRNKREKKVGEFIQDMLKAYKINDKVAEFNIKEHWPEIVGEMVSRHTTKVFVKNNTLHIYISSSVVKFEVQHHSGLILERVQQLLNNNSIKEVKVY